MTTLLSRQFEIDHDRGVIYVHLSNREDVEKLGIVTAVRISKLPSPILNLKGRGLIGDILTFERKTYATINRTDKRLEGPIVLSILHEMSRSCANEKSWAFTLAMQVWSQTRREGTVV
jgi:hypothetical protein